MFRKLHMLNKGFIAPSLHLNLPYQIAARQIANSVGTSDFVWSAQY